MYDFSFVIPCYNSSQTIEGVLDEIIKTVDIKNTYEIICVNDHSTDNVFDVICARCHHDQRIKILNLARNVGQHNALMAGYSVSQGKRVIYLDDDGQSPIGELYRFACELDKGADVVMGITTNKKHRGLKRLGSKLNDFMAYHLVGAPKNLNVVPFNIMERFIIEEIINYKGPYTYMAGLIFRTTKNVVLLEVNHRERVVGQSNYSIKKMLSLWMNGFTAFSVKPLRLASLLGFVTAMVGFVFAAYTIVTKLLNPSIAVGYSSIIVAIMFIGGMNLLALGLIGEYLGRMYLSINNTPQYVIKEKVNFEV